jgi:hypothetical protein
MLHSAVSFIWNMIIGVQCAQWRTCGCIWRALAILTTCLVNMEGTIHRSWNTGVSNEAIFPWLKAYFSLKLISIYGKNVHLANEELRVLRTPPNFASCCVCRFSNPNLVVLLLVFPSSTNKRPLHFTLVACTYSTFSSLSHPLACFDAKSSPSSHGSCHRFQAKARRDWVL